MMPLGNLPRLAISVRQPWAWALFNGKHVENRGPAAIRHMHGKMKPGPSSRLVIHAAKGMTMGEYVYARRFMAERCNVACPHPAQLVRGAIIGEVIYVDCITASASPWWMGPRGMIFERPAIFHEPLGCVGQLGFFEWEKGIDPLALQSPKLWMQKWRADPKPPPIIEGKTVEPMPLFEDR